mmetsp:Transcript_51368/g.123996  ORF Transcript_51368/g.123996 Transcript_51368/m.123996 type:complete len:616 (-) Transcript_51368:427-2274(-)
MNVPSNTRDGGGGDNVGEVAGDPEPEKDTPSKATVESSTDPRTEDTVTPDGKSTPKETVTEAPGGGASPSQNNSNSNYTNLNPVSTPQQQPRVQQQQQGYYVAYPPNSQVTPEPPSPHTTGGTAIYDVGSFLQQPGAPTNIPGAAAGYSPFTGPLAGPPVGVGGVLQAPNSPGSVGIPPASPLFPRMTVPSSSTALLDRIHGNNDIHSRIALSPGPQYNGGYMTGGGFIGSKEDEFGWGDNRGIPSPYPPSPQISSHGIPFVPGMPGRATNDRSNSFDDTMLPPPAQSHLYGGAGGSPGGAGNLFAQQQQWGYGSPMPDSYGYGSSPLQPRPTVSYGHAGGPPPRHHPRHAPHLYDHRAMNNPGSQYFPATSPGPPIQTAGSNKGPDGANLFIFHIPNHFTNVDMYQLFVPYGNLLSVRIMVEKDTGRSRGFGFVSYDSPDSAALAIKELNGFAIGNKRLKVQHKQIRQNDPYFDRYQGGYGNDGNYQHPQGAPGGGQYPPHDQLGYHSGRGRGGMYSSLPPSGPSAGGYYNRDVGDRAPGGGGGGPQPVPSNGVSDPRSSPVSSGNGGVGEYDGSSGPQPPQATPSDPLGTMDSLRQTLPDVGGTPTQVGASEN